MSSSLSYEHRIPASKEEDSEINEINTWLQTESMIPATFSCPTTPLPMNESSPTQSTIPSIFAPNQTFFPSFPHNHLFSNGFNQLSYTFQPFSSSSSSQSINFGSPLTLAHLPPPIPLASHANSIPCHPSHLTSFSTVGTGPLLTATQPGMNLTPQMIQFFSQFHQLLNANESGPKVEESDEKKRRQARPFVRRVRQTRPKVVESKGAIQCKGRNRKKNIQCRNAALMEYMGPRPIYCAEHIELDPKSLYEKCKAAYQKEPGDNKGCKEVVLKEFGLCYKHYVDAVEEMIRTRNYEKAQKHYNRILEILSQLEKEATAAKKKDGDLYQRKNKLIPKFQEMKKCVSKALEILRPKDGATTLSPSLHQNSHQPHQSISEFVNTSSTSTSSNYQSRLLYDVSLSGSDDVPTDEDQEKVLEGDICNLELETKNEIEL